MKFELDVVEVLNTVSKVGTVVGMLCGGTAGLIELKQGDNHPTINFGKDKQKKLK